MTTALIKNSIEEKPDLEQIVNSMILSFSTDPLLRWVYSLKQQYLKSFPNFVKILGSQSLELQTVYHTQDCSGAAFWLPPQSQLNKDAIGAYMQKTIAPQQQEKVFSLFEEISHTQPEAPHWYLALLGVEPTKQGQGYGSALIQPVLQKCDRLNQIAYLEASSLKSASFYERHGFEYLAIIQVDDSPQIFPMVRYPKSI